VFLAKRAK